MIGGINPILVESWRGNTLESFHRGVVCIVGSDKKILFSKGDVQQLCFPRSALKLFQHIPLIESGAADHFQFTPEEIAIMCGSHNGEELHQQVVQNILNKIGLDASYLACGPQMPTLKEDAQKLIIQNKPPLPIMNNCSGKHAGFLAMAVYRGDDPSTYWKPEHPVQKLIQKTVSEMHDAPMEAMDIALDGCSAPIFSLTVYQQALGYMRLTGVSGDLDTNRQMACRRIVEAITQFPYMVAGKNRYCTQMMEVYGNEIAGKTGADGIYSMAISRLGLGICIKIDDGKMNPQYLVAQHIIDALGIKPQQSDNILEKYREEMQRNFNKFSTGPLRVPLSAIPAEIHI